VLQTLLRGGNKGGYRQRDVNPRISRGLLASVALHVGVLVFLLVGLPGVAILRKARG
jgi:hypothetical protein